MYAHYQRSNSALVIRERAYGDQHVSVATTLNGLALTLKAQGRLDAAKALFERALSINQKVSGPSHPNVAANLGNLASLAHDRFEFAEAESLHQRSIELYE